MSSHTHHYSYWHSHEHEHDDTGKLRMTHTAGHHHFYAQTHEHGPQSNKIPHSHKDKQFHPTNNAEGPYHHHAVADHEIEEEEK